MSKSYRIEITTTAKVEAEEAILWIKQNSPDAAIKFRKDLTEAIKSLQKNPFRCPIAPENNVFYEEIRQLILGKYRILITIAEETVYVLYIRHSSQQFVKQEFDEDLEN